MANVQLKRGQQTQADVTFIADGETNAFNFSSGYTAELVIRRKVGNSFNGELIDTLSSSVSESVLGYGRITFIYTEDGPNIQLLWTTLQAEALPNETTTVYGDLKVTYDSQVKHSFRIPFDIIPEII